MLMIQGNNQFFLSTSSYTSNRSGSISYALTFKTWIIEDNAYDLKGYFTVYQLLVSNMKEISIIIRTDDLAKVTEILRKHNVGGITFYDISGAGRMKREAIPERVHFYMTGKKITPDYVRRTKVETIVPDSTVNQIVGDVSDSLSQHAAKDEAHGMIFVKNVSDAYEIGTKQRGEAVLSP